MNLLVAMVTGGLTFAAALIVLTTQRRALVRDRLSGMSLTQTAKKYGVSRASVVRFVREAMRRDGAASFAAQEESSAVCA